MDHNELQETLISCAPHLDNDFYCEYPLNQSVLNYVRRTSCQQSLAREQIASTVLRAIIEKDEKTLQTWTCLLSCTIDQLQCLDDENFVARLLLLFEETYAMTVHVLDLVSRYHNTQITVTIYHDTETRTLLMLPEAQRSTSKSSPVFLFVTRSGTYSYVGKEKLKRKRSQTIWGEQERDSLQRILNEQPTQTAKNITRIYLQTNMHPNSSFTVMRKVYALRKKMRCDNPQQQEDFIRQCITKNET